MTLGVFLSLFSIAFVAAWTPGPNNTLVANSAVNFGFRKTIPHISGIGLGFPFMVFCIGFGLGAVFQSSSLLREVLRWGGIAVLMWFAWKIANGGKIKNQDTGDRPFTFFESAAFQWINPKGWVMAISITSQFVSADAMLSSALIVAGVFVTAGFTSASGWALFGKAMQAWLTSPARLRAFNYTMAALLVLSVLMIAKSDLV